MHTPTRDEIDRACRWFQDNPADIDHLVSGRVSQGAAWHASVLARAALVGAGPAPVPVALQAASGDRLAAAALALAEWFPARWRPVARVLEAITNWEVTR